MTTVLVEPDYEGHHLRAAAHVADVARRSGPVILLTSHEIATRPAYAEFIEGEDIEIREVFDGKFPATKDVLAEIQKVRAGQQVDTVVIMDADQTLKRWWYLAPRAFGFGTRPRIVFMLTRYPARLRLTDWVGWRLRGPKAILAALAMLTGTLHRAAGFAGRDETAPGWIVKRTRDPDVCSAHSRDRDAIRAELGLPLDRKIIGIFGGINERRNADMVWDAMQLHGIEADLLLAGRQNDVVRAWVAALPPSPLGSLIIFDDFLPTETMDKLIAASDLAPIPLTNNGPSGVMGSAIAAGVPVVTAGSMVRAREVTAAGVGEATDLTADALGKAFQRILAQDPATRPAPRIAPATPEEFASSLLGVPFERS